MKTDNDGDPTECPKCGGEVEMVQNHSDFNIAYSWDADEKEWVEGDESTGFDDRVQTNFNCTGCGESIRHIDEALTEETPEACRCQARKEEEEEEEQEKNEE